MVLQYNSDVQQFADLVGLILFVMFASTVLLIV
jgi:hypothetical protein